jgi:hypothetical protein
MSRRLPRLFEWRTAAQVRRQAIALVVLQALTLAFFVAGTHGWITKGVAPTTTDYASFYAAGRLADEGRPADAYDRARHLAAEEQATEPGIKYEYFFNPPPYLLINQPLALLPYLPSFLLFEAVTFGLWLALGARVAGPGPAVVPALLAVPSVWWVLGLGQNSFLNAALMAAGTLLLEQRPWLAGVAFGALCYKPHLGLLVPVALLFGRQWRAFASAGATVAAICAATLALYGPDTWRAFFTMALHSDQAIGGGDVLFAAHIDPSGALRYAGVPLAIARAIGGLLALATAGCVAWAWARPARAPVRYALLVAGTLIVVPFALFYDLVLASLAAAWLARAARQGGFLRGEKAGMGICIGLNLLAAVPVVTRGASGVAFGALVPPILVALALRRAWAEGAVAEVVPDAKAS